jgi:hypothetical protein
MAGDHDGNNTLRPGHRNLPTRVGRATANPSLPPQFTPAQGRYHAGDTLVSVQTRLCARLNALRLSTGPTERLAAIAAVSHALSVGCRWTFQFVCM